MNTIKEKVTIALLALSLGYVLPAAAHTGADHPKKNAPIKKEQTAWGIAGDAKSITRTIVVTMSDTMRFSPERIDVNQGQTVRLVIKNKGKILHEFVMGTKKELDEHAALMLKSPNMEHAEPYMAHVNPKESSEIVWTFNKAGEFDFACLIAGHYQAGMVGKITVKPSSRGAGKHPV